MSYHVVRAIKRHSSQAVVHAMVTSRVRAPLRRCSPKGLIRYLGTLPKCDLLRIAAVLGRPAPRRWK